MTRCLLIGALAVVPLLHAAAQSTRSLSIRDGKVFIDEKEVPRERLPGSIDVDGIQVLYTFSGDVNPVIEIKDGTYKVEDDRLVQVPNYDSASFEAFSRRSGLLPADFDSLIAAAAPPAVAYHMIPSRTRGIEEEARALYMQARQLETHARKLEDLHRRAPPSLQPESVDELEAHARRMAEQAAHAAQLAEALPFVEIRDYLIDVQSKDGNLYEHLVTESNLERESLQLARTINKMPDGPERRRHVEELEARLEAIFELKQNNRRREVEQLEDRLSELQERLQERERLREEIILRRLDQLIGGSGEFRW